MRRHELGLDLVEDARHLRRLHLRLEVVEQDVVRLVGLLEAVDVAVPQLDVALEQRQEDVEVRRRLRLEPDGRGLRGRLHHLAAQLRRHLDGLRVVAPRRADDRRVPRVRVERVEPRLELVEQPADLRVGQLLVREPLEQRHVARALHEAGRRHRRALVPREQGREVVERRVVGESRGELLEGVGHRRGA